ncbi:MAG: preprotein translocase subunit SecG, partial [Polyangiaceae bacterium]
MSDPEKPAPPPNQTIQLDALDPAEAEKLVGSSPSSLPPGEGPHVRRKTPPPLPPSALVSTPPPDA